MHHLSQFAHDYFTKWNWNSYRCDDVCSANSPSWSSSCVTTDDGNYYVDDPLHCSTNFSCFVHCIRHCEFVVPHVYPFRSSSLFIFVRFVLSMVLLDISFGACIDIIPLFVGTFRFLAPLFGSNSHYFGLLDPWVCDPKVCRVRSRMHKISVCLCWT